MTMAHLGKPAGVGLFLIVIGGGPGVGRALRILPLGRLPGDLSYRGKNVTVFIPLGT